MMSIVVSAVVVTGFVLLMMLLVEYLNVVTRGALRERIGKHGGRLPAVVIGTTPGCFGGFTNVTLYVHGALSLGALAGSMIATSGDEAFVMLALFPRRAILLFVVLLLYGFLVAHVVDRLFGLRCYGQRPCDSGLVVHPAEAVNLRPFRFRPREVHWSGHRALLMGGVLLFSGGIGWGFIAEDESFWLRAIIFALGLLLLWLLLVAPDHFVREHLVKHVVREHAPRILLWTLGALLVTDLALKGGLGIEVFIRAHPALALFVAALVGIIPESGPHLVFATLYGGGLIPFSVLLTSSAVQDGHAMLPLLAESRVEFAKVKAINLVAGLALGLVAMLIGF